MELTYSLQDSGSGTYTVLDERGTELSNPLPRDKAVDLVRRYENGAHYGDPRWTVLTGADNGRVAEALGVADPLTEAEKAEILAKTGRWERVFAGFYRRIGNDGVTVLAEVGRDEDGTWSYLVKPFGKASLSWQVTCHATMAEAKRMAEAAYRRYMAGHRAANAG